MPTQSRANRSQSRTPYAPSTEPRQFGLARLISGLEIFLAYPDLGTQVG